MRSLTDLPNDELQVALEASESLIRHKAYLPGSLLLMLLGKFRDDIHESLGMEVTDLPRRARERGSLDELTSVELDTVSGAVGILLQGRFTRVMDDPALPRMLGGFNSTLGEQKTERADIKASMAS